jgi:PEP-CTERM/exosortase A-associated glycosyltransferase
MTVLHLLDHSAPIHSGYSFRSRSIVIQQRQLGLRPVILTSPKQGSSQDGAETIEEIPHYRTARTGNGTVFLREIRQMTRMAARIIEIARIEGVSVLHAHSPLLNGLPALWAGRVLGLPVVYEARAFWEDAAVDHGTFREGSLRYRVSRSLETFLFRKADAVVTICKGMREEVIRRGVDRDRVTVVGNGVDVNWFAPRPRNAELASGLGLGDGPVFGFVGSFYHYEGLRFLLDAFPEVLRILPQARLLFVGGGREESAMRNAARGLGQTVIFAGQVPHSEIRDYYSVIDIFLCPRRRMRLTELVTPLKPLEAMAMARPVLASDVGGLTELVEHEVTGLLFPAESREGLVQQAARMGSDPDLRRRLGKCAQRHVAGQRTWSGTVSRYPQVYSMARSVACGRI